MLAFQDPIAYNIYSCLSSEGSLPFCFTDKIIYLASSRRKTINPHIWDGPWWSEAKRYWQREEMKCMKWKIMPIVRCSVRIGFQCITYIVFPIIGTALNDSDDLETKKIKRKFPIDFRVFGLQAFARSTIDYWNSLSHMKTLRNLVHYAVAISVTTSTLAVCLRLIYFK